MCLNWVRQRRALTVVFSSDLALPKVIKATFELRKSESGSISPVEVEEGGMAEAGASRDVLCDSSLHCTVQPV